MTEALPCGADSTRAGAGVDAMGMVMLVCAVLASLALGVLVAYVLCQAMFRVFRVHAENAARSRSAGQALRMARG